MKESIGTSLSWIKTNAFRMGLMPTAVAPKGNGSAVVRVIETDTDVDGQAVN